MRRPERNVDIKKATAIALVTNILQVVLVVAIAAQVAAEDMFEMTLEYVKSRQAFGKAISDFQNTKFKLAEMATELEMGRTFLDQLIASHMAGEEVVTKVSMAKWKLTDMAKRFSAECMQLFGGYGYMEEYKIARRFRDTPVASIYAGTNEIMKTIIAKNIGL